ncbi:MAG: hypothetical protein J6W00_00935 [Lentisphaeria bacterium]|nr:hypothetical protein [Lentisphaeria bacterium]
MAEELQSLLEKINQDGIMKAEAEKAKIIADAEKSAAEIIAEAKKSAAGIIAEAEKESAVISEKTVSALEQSRRNIILQIRQELASRLHAAVGESAAAALSPEFMAQLIRELAVAFAAKPDSLITIRTAVKDADALDSALKAALADSFVKAPGVFPGKEIAAGMEISFDGGKCFYDFTLDAVSDLLDAYIGDKLKNIFQAEK